MDKIKIKAYAGFVMAMMVFSCSKSKSSKVTLTYDGGQIKQEKVFIDGFEDSLNYILLQYHPDGSIELEGKIKNGKEDGTYTWYYQNGNEKWVEKFEDGTSIDSVYCYYESGKLKRINLPSLYDYNYRPAVEYYQTGEVKIKTYLNNGEYIDSLWEGFYKNGKIKEVGMVDDGTKIGYWRFYDIDGSLIDSIDQTAKSKIVFDFEEEEEKMK